MLKELTVEEKRALEPVIRDYLRKEAMSIQQAEYNGSSVNEINSRWLKLKIIRRVAEELGLYV